MIESLRTTPGVCVCVWGGGGGGGGETRHKSIRAKGPCKGKSYETICENIVSRYQTLVSSLPWEYFFLQRRPKTEFFNWAAQ